MTTDIRIDFKNNPIAVFYPGDLLSGTVWLSLSEEKEVRGVYIRIYGKAYCCWKEGMGDESTTYTGKEQYINGTSYLVGMGPGSPEGNIKLKPGTHSYDFQCHLPNELPTSVEGKKGYIRYTARVTVDIPMGFNKELKERFTVLRPLNLNSIRELRHPITSEISKMDCCSSCCCCLCSCLNQIEVIARIPVGGYTPGQYINLQLHVNHSGSPKDYEFSVKLMKQIDYYTNIVETCCRPVGPDHNKEMQCITKKEVSCHISNTNSVEIIRVNLQVPPVPPTDYDNSNIVKVSYYLEIATSAGCGGSPKNIIPITIGTYPIEDFDAPNSIANAPVLNQPTASPHNTTSPKALDKELPEAMDMFDAGGGNFKPKYPVFKRKTSYSIGQ